MNTPPPNSKTESKLSLRHPAARVLEHNVEPSEDAVSTETNQAKQTLSDFDNVFKLSPKVSSNVSIESHILSCFRKNLSWYLAKIVFIA